MCNCNNCLDTSSISVPDGNNGNYTVTRTFEGAEGGCTNGGVAIELYNGVTNALISTSYACNGVDASLTPLVWNTLPLKTGWVVSTFTPSSANNTPRYAISNGFLYLTGIIQNFSVDSSAEQDFVDVGLFTSSRFIRTSCHEWNRENHVEIRVDTTGTIGYYPRTLSPPENVILLLDSIPPIYIGSF